MLASILLKLGINLGHPLDINLLEDVEIRRAIIKRNLVDLDRIIADRNEKHSTWGWKFPTSVELLEHFEKTLRNPFYIFSFRDPVAIASRNRLAEGIEPSSNIRDALNYMALINDFSAKTRHPCLFVSYEKAIQKPRTLVDSLANLLCIDSDVAKLQAAANAVDTDNTAYKKAYSGNTYEGWLDQVSCKIASGWAWKKSDDERIVVSLFVDGVFVASVTANEFREDLKREDIGDGRHAFTFRLDELIEEPAPKTSIDVRFSTTGESLFGSPATI